jgi:GNAT superfamily N-acetyltransferase
MFEEMAKLAGNPIPGEFLQRVETDRARLFAKTLGHSQFGWIAEINGAPACTGMLALQDWLPHSLYPNAKRAYMHSMYTEPARRGNGMAKAITTRAITWCRAHGFDALVLHASEQGRPMYEKMGFIHANEWRIAL